MPRIIQYFTSRDDTVSLTTANLELQKAEDIDLLWEHRTSDGHVLSKSIEVKVDTQIHKTRNFAFEVVVGLLEPKQGCFVRTTSDYLFYVSSVSGELWIMTTKVAQEWFADEITNISKLGNRKSRWPIVTTNSALSNGRYYTAVCYLVPEKDLVEGLGNHLWVRQLP